MKKSPLFLVFFIVSMIFSAISADGASEARNMTLFIVQASGTLLSVAGAIIAMYSMSKEETSTKRLPITQRKTPTSKRKIRAAA